LSRLVREAARPTKGEAMSVEEIEQRLAARASEPAPESWKHEKPGDQIIGRFRRLERGTTTYGDCWIVVLESLRTPGRLASVWLFNTTLYNEFRRARPRPGEVVLVRYEGKVERQGAQPYHLWKVVVDRPAAAESPYSWNDVDGGDGDAPTPDELQARDDVGPVHPQGDYFGAGDEPQNWADDDIPF
jgi:hypothetical protein